MPKYLRVTDKDTGHKRTVTESQLPHGNYTVLKQDAVDLYGDPLPPEFSTVEPTGHKADTPKEK
tara:strand:+ start:7739 stop:7930 length:192 start_codon:yes stop_codon:yes gene_type:complete